MPKLGAHRFLSNLVFDEAERRQGEGNLEDAYLLYRFAARHGQVQAAMILGTQADPAYHGGAGGYLPEPAPGQAFKWYSKAAEAGNDEAVQRLRIALDNEEQGYGAARALGLMGGRGVPTLMDALLMRHNIPLQRRAASGLVWAGDTGRDEWRLLWRNRTREELDRVRAAFEEGVDIRLPTKTSAKFEREGWELVTTVLVPALSPMVLMVLLLDALMSRVWMAERSDEDRLRYRQIIWLNLTLSLILILAFMPYFSSLAR